MKSVITNSQRKLSLSFTSSLNSLKQNLNYKLDLKRLFNNNMKSILLFSSFFFIAKHKTNNALCDIPKKKKPYLGCSIRAKDDYGMKIIMIKSDSPAEKANLKLGDVIISINDNYVNSIKDFYVAVGSTDGVKKIKIRRFKDQKNEHDYSEMIVEVNFILLEHEPDH